MIASAPEMYQGLVYAVEALEGTREFMRVQNLKTDEISEILSVIHDLINRIDGNETGAQS